MAWEIQWKGCTTSKQLTDWQLPRKKDMEKNLLSSGGNRFWVTCSSLLYDYHILLDYVTTNCFIFPQTRQEKILSWCK